MSVATQFRLVSTGVNSSAIWERLGVLIKGTSSRIVIRSYSLPSMNGVPNSVAVIGITDEHDEIATFQTKQLPSWIECYSLRNGSRDKNNKLSPHQVVELCNRWLLFMKELMDLICRLECVPISSLKDFSVTATSNNNNNDNNDNDDNDNDDHLTDK